MSKFEKLPMFENNCLNLKTVVKIWKKIGHGHVFMTSRDKEEKGLKPRIWTRHHFWTTPKSNFILFWLKKQIYPEQELFYFFFEKLFMNFHITKSHQLEFRQENQLKNFIKLKIRFYSFRLSFKFHYFTRFSCRGLKVLSTVEK